MITIEKGHTFTKRVPEQIPWDDLVAGDSILVEDNRAAMRVLVRLRHYQKMGRYNHLIMRRKKTGEGKQIRIWFLAAE